MTSSELIKKFIQDAQIVFESKIINEKGQVFRAYGQITCLLYIKTRASESQNWGITANVVKRLKNQSVPWFILLLSVLPTSGYLLTSEDTESYIKNKWRLNIDGDYKTSPSFPDEKSFNTIEQLTCKIKDEIPEFKNENPKSNDTSDAISITEGGEKVIISLQAERNSKLRQMAIRIHGLYCKVCGFDFEKTYGEWGHEFIEVHHMQPLGAAKKLKVETDPEIDLTVLCSNCHSMVHHKRGITLTIEELKNKIKNALCSI